MTRCLRWLNVCFIGIAVSCLCSCGSGSKYTLSLTVSGLSGDLSIILYKNVLTQGDTLAFTADDTKSFTTKLTSSDLYSFSLTAPTGQTCTVENATGSISADTTLRVLCDATDSLFTVSGVVTGLSSGQGISLKLNNGETKLLGSGNFSFNSLPEGYQYTLSLLIDGPGKRCSVTNSSGTISGNVRSQISCQKVTIIYANGSVYNGNLGGLDGAEQKCAVITANMGSHYSCDVNKVFLSTSTSHQIADFPTLYSARADLPVYAHDTSGPAGEVLFQDNWSGLLSANGGFDQRLFLYDVWTGSEDDGTLEPFDTCEEFTDGTAGNTSGIWQGSAFQGGGGLPGGLWGTSIACSWFAELACICLHQNYQVGGTVSGLLSGQVVLRLTHSDDTTEDITVTGNSAFYFNEEIEPGDTYAASIVSSTATGGCTLTGTTSGTVSSSSASALTVACEDEDTSDGVSIGGTVTGLSGTVVLSLNAGAQQASIASDGSFTFGTSLTAGATYEVTVGIHPLTQICTVANGSGTASANVTNITVTCTSSNPTIGGTVSGLSGTVVLSLNSGAQTASITADGSFTFGTSLTAGATYEVTVGTQPSTQTCTVANGSGTANGSVSNITVTCAKTLTSIAVTPNNPSVNLFVNPTQQFTATGTYSDATTANLTSSVTWASSSTNIATISSSGLATLVTLGTTNITATSSGVVSNTSTLTVVP